jgi:hypothetical protein
LLACDAWRIDHKLLDLETDIAGFDDLEHWQAPGGTLRPFKSVPPLQPGSL